MKVPRGKPHNDLMRITNKLLEIVEEIRPPGIEVALVVWRPRGVQLEVAMSAREGKELEFLDVIQHFAEHLHAQLVEDDDDEPKAG